MYSYKAQKIEKFALFLLRYLELPVADQEVILAAVDSLFVEMVRFVKAIADGADSYDKLSKTTCLSKDQVKERLNALIRGSFPIKIDKKIRYKSKNVKGDLVSLHIKPVNHAFVELESPIDNWAIAKAKDSGLSKNEFVNASLLMYKTISDNRSLPKLARERNRRKAELELGNKK